jgi:hypothetical protein
MSISPVEKKKNFWSYWINLDITQQDIDSSINPAFAAFLAYSMSCLIRSGALMAFIKG